MKPIEVNIGNIVLGAGHPVAIQSMANTDTMNVEDTVRQVMRIFDAGADLVRISTPSIKEAETLIEIKKRLVEDGYTNPLIADVHFSPKVAEYVAGIVQKVRINPGNYVEKSLDTKIEYTDDEYLDVLKSIAENITPLINICKKNKTALRIGANHGSLSQRIINRYGNTPEGMAESVMEFLRVCKDQQFMNIVVSMKSSNTRVMVHASRLLVKKMEEEGCRFPVHLGVTEAGGGVEARVKSAVGIGTLLKEGIGNTVRVSLTEPPENEIPVAREIVESSLFQSKPYYFFNPFDFNKRQTKKIDEIIGGDIPAVVISSCNDSESTYLPDIFYDEYNMVFKSNRDRKLQFPYYSPEKYVHVNDGSKPAFVEVSNVEDIKYLYGNGMDDNSRLALVLKSYDHKDSYAVFCELESLNAQVPVVIKKLYHEDDYEKLMLTAAADLGAFFIDGFGDGIWIENIGEVNQCDVISLSFKLLQATRARMFETEVIACPTCGRTRYDVQSTMEEVKEKMGHLKGLKIAVMGCIVNGPGEMADADYGYVGAGPGKICLYKGKEMIKKNIPESMAMDELIKLIKENNDWHPRKK